MRKKILVVEDEPDQLEVIRFTLKNAGFAVGTATNGIEALKKAQTVSPDLIIMDVMMPELDGFAVCETLRGNPATASLPILLLTGLCSHISRLVGYRPNKRPAAISWGTKQNNPMSRSEMGFYNRPKDNSL